MSVSITRFLCLLSLILVFLVPAVGALDADAVPVTAVLSEVRITADSSVPGYVAKGITNADKVFAGYGDVVLISGTDIPYGKILHAEVTIGSSVSHLQGYEISLSGFPQNRVMLIRVHLSLATDPHPPIIDNGGEGGGNDDDDEGDKDDSEGGNNAEPKPEPENPKPSNPVNPGRPVVPDTPGTDTPDVPDTPGNPDTPDVPDTPSVPSSPGVPGKPTVVPSTPSGPEHPDTPGSDEPFVPILPPADSVYNLAGFIPIGAGFLLLFLVFFWKRKVYRILKSHAKKHGEKPEKEHLKEIADAIIKLVRDEGRYPEWKKNSDVAKRLSADIVSVLDEMNYARAVPRGALVAEIIKAAKGRINRHRL